MIDLLLITDIPRVRKIFSRLTDDRNIRLRIANNLEKGAEELTAEKPTVVFVQTHLSGLSADIILMHLKKQLGRKRTHFVLLATTDQVSRETIASYHGHIDIALSDEAVQLSTRELLATLLAKPARKAAAPSPVPTTAGEPVPVTFASPAPAREIPPVITPLSLPNLGSTAVQAPIPDTASQQASQELPVELSPQEQGIAYPSRTPLSVYSEFNSSFDSAVETMPPPTAVSDNMQQQQRVWKSLDMETTLPVAAPTKRTFLLWLIPVVAVVVVVTVLQQQRSKPEMIAIKPASAPVIQPEPAKPSPKPAVPSAPAAGATAPAAAVVTPPVVAPPTVKTPVAAPAPVLAPKPPKPAPAPSTTTPRLKKLPDFIPRYGYDKKYGTENPGWERYKGQVTEFKILREGEGIKAIQVLDRGGRGVPESFMKGVLRQLAKNPVLLVESTEKKEGYQIQRGQLSETQDVVYYRDSDGGRLRGFVVTWH